jgi:ATPase subunit of ABC transporter with duplicated ATPase domains
MSKEASLTFQNVSFRYEGMEKPIVDRLTAHFPAGWTGIAGANGAGKTTILKLASGLLFPDSGTVQMQKRGLYCAQRTDDMPELFGDLMQATDGLACELKGRLGVQEEWLARWESLSHGERKRTQIAVALWQEPAVFAVDEPTNHIDGEARQLLLDTLRSFKGIGLLVSHDRELLDALCMQTLFVAAQKATMHPGGYTAAYQLEKEGEQQVRDLYEQKSRMVSKIQRTVSDRRREAARADRARSKRDLDRHDSDGRAKIDLARVSGMDGVAGRLQSQLSGRLRQAQEELSGIKVTKTYKLGVWLETARSRRDKLFSVPAGNLALGEKRQLLFPELDMLPDDRIAITGQNGAGKSTLIRHILRCLNVEPAHLVYLPQEVDLQESREIMAHVRGLPKDKIGRIMTIVSCLGSRPERLLETEAPSPGEIRKILLAIGITCGPHLIMMDEPTNHLDLPSIECLEEMLAECPCGLLLVSHDKKFLDKLARQRWDIGPSDQTPEQMVLKKKII